MTGELRGGPELSAGLRALGNAPQLAARAGPVAGRILAAAIGEFAPGSLGGTVEVTVQDRDVIAGSRSPYARWFHVPHLSAGGVTHAKKVSTRGRSYGQRIPDDPWMINAAKKASDDVFRGYVEVVEKIIADSLSGVDGG